MELSLEIPEPAVWPKLDDRLFRNDSDLESTARLNIGGKSFDSYAIGYKRAGDALAIRFIDKWQGNEILLFPMIFLYRQYLELRLKELLLSGKRSVGESGDFEETHELPRLWKPCQKILAEHWPEEPCETWDNVSRLIDEFHKIDPSGEAFRYPYTSKMKGRKITVPANCVGVRNFYEVMQRLAAFFEAHSEGIDAWRRED